MSRIADDVLLTHLEVALAVAPEPTLAGLIADDPRAQRSARVDLARHLVERSVASLSRVMAIPAAEFSPACFRATWRRSGKPHVA
jgi:hypothetical protein